MRKRKLQDSTSLTQGLAPLVGWGEVRLAPLVRWGEVRLAPLVRWGEVRLAPLVRRVEVHLAPLVGKGEVHLAPLAGWGEVHPGNRRREKVEQINARLSRCGKITVRSPCKCVRKSTFMQRLYAGTARHPGCCNNLFIT